MLAGRCGIGRGPNGPERQLGLCLGPRVLGPAGDRGERLGRRGRASRVRLGQLHLDQLRQERDGDEVVPAGLVQAAMQTGGREGGLASCQVQGDHGLDGLGRSS
jgi:hypothetical protein